MLMTCDTPSRSAVTETTFGSLADSAAATLYTLRNANGMEVALTNYGGIVQKLTAPDRDGNYEDIVLGFDSVTENAADSPYFGAIIGRYGNRIGSGKDENRSLNEIWPQRLAHLPHKSATYPIIESHPVSRKNEAEIAPRPGR